MKASTRLPLQLNDGTPVPQSQLDGYLGEFLDQFGGLTNEGVVGGYWRSDDGEFHFDESLKVVVMLENEQVPRLRELLYRIGAELQQKTMYLELDEHAHVELLETS